MSQPDQRRILVIDDDRLFLEITSYHLSRSGYSVEVASDPRQGLHRAIEQSFDLILLDLMMPELNGAEVLGLLKPLGLQHRVIVVTAHDDDYYRARARDLGAAGYVRKPVDPDELQRVVGATLGSIEDSGPPDGPARRPGLAGALAGWVFDEPAKDGLQQAVGVGLVASLMALLVWLIFG